MRLARSAALGALVILGSSAPAPASPRRGAAALAPVPLTPGRVACAARSSPRGVTAGPDGPALVLGRCPESGRGPTHDDLPAGDVALVFVRSARGTWTALEGRAGEDVFGAFASADGRVAVVTMWASEGPGDRWNLTLFGPGSERREVELRFPDTLNRPSWANEFLEPVELALDHAGRGLLVGRAVTDHEPAARFVYTTTDGGKTWSAPRQVEELPARPEPFAKVGEGAVPEALLAELRGFAAGRASLERAPHRRRGERTDPRRDDRERGPSR
jgi:hypothetical protein